jgi:hypothetical protein
MKRECPARPTGREDDIIPFLQDTLQEAFELTQHFKGNLEDFEGDPNDISTFVGRLRLALDVAKEVL